jgi:cyanate permease
LAGLAAPWLAGLLYDARGDYHIALLVATVLSLASAAVAAMLKPGASFEEWAARLAARQAGPSTRPLFGLN